MLERGDRVTVPPVADGQRARCGHCAATLQPGERLEVLVAVDGDDPAVLRRACIHCARGRIRPATDRACVLVSGLVAPSLDADGHSQLVLSGATVVDRTG